jgi:hypothetical protein
MTELTTNFSASPYFDDYKLVDGGEGKNYYRILFRPATAVQARELNQIQAMFQEQIARLSDFKDGSVVDGCAPNYIPKFDFVRTVDLFNTNTARIMTSLSTSYLITNSTDSDYAVRAQPVIYKDGYQLQYPATNRIYLNYISSGKDSANNQLDTFRSADTLYIFNENQSKLGTLDANNIIDSISVITANTSAAATGQGYGVRVSDGVIYQKGHLINVTGHTITVKDYDTNPNTYVVGFQTTETLVTPDMDSNLTDNALGYPNEKAPGAHRLQLTSTLVAMTRAETANNKNFFALMEFDSNQPTEQNFGEEKFDRIRVEIAKRTAEESGNYVVKPFSIELSPIAANTSHFTYDVSSGIVYVNGYRKEKGPGTSYVPAKKATDTKLSNAQTVSTNFGNYVLVDECVGVFDFDKLGSVTLYDAAQFAVSGYQGTASAATGAIIGTATVTGFQFDNGNKGTSTAQYRLYLTNVVLNANRRFADVRSIVLTGGAFGNARADTVLINGETQLQDGNRDILVYPIGLNAVKTLYEANTTPDTQFIFRDIKAGTLAIDGTVTFTINLSTAGGNEKLVDSVGFLSNNRELMYNIVLDEAAYTSDLGGTLSVVVNATNLTLTGTGTLFTQQFVPGDLINISAAYNSSRTTKVISVDSDTQMTVALNTNIPAGVGVNYRKYYVKGHVVNLSQFGGTIEVLNVLPIQSQFKVDTKLNLGGTLIGFPKPIYAEYPVLRSEARQIAKEIKKNRFVAINCSANPGGITGPWNLGFSDVAKIRGIYVGSTYANTNPERSAWFSFDNGQRDSFYDHGTITIKPQYKSNISSTSRILVELDYFIANTTPGVGFYSVDSYPVDDINYLSDATKIHTAEIPRYFSKTFDTYIDLRNAIDFRPRRTNTALDETNPGSATPDPAKSSTYVIPPTGQFLPDPDTTFQCDIQYYLPRVDLICMNKEGDIVVRSGEADIVPLEPKNELDTAVIARIDVKPYPTIGTREAEAFNRRDLASKVTNRIIKRYTMDDIGALEKRIERMEFYTTLNLLEQKAKDMIIPDANGLDRFKNGIFADNFNSHLLGKVSDIEYFVSVDKDKSLARPLFETYDIDTQFDSSNSVNIQQTGPYLTLPYSNTVFIQQKYATKFRNCCESIWQWNGKINLYPTYDHFRDETLAPAINNTLDLSAPWEEFANSPFGTNFGDWRVTGSTSTQNSRTNTTDTTRTRTTTTTTQTTSERIVSDLNVDTTTEQINLGTFVTDFSISPYMRSRNVAFVVSGLKPNTQMHAFFDNVNVDQFCAPGVLTGITNVEAGKEDRVVERTGDWNTPLVSDASGNLYGVFNIPAGQFRTGDREFVISTVTDLITGADAQLSKAVAQFTASNISVTKQTSTLNTILPVLSVSTSTQSQVQSSTITSQQITRIPQRSERSDPEPIAQSFKVLVPESSSGMFTTGVGVYFQSKDPTLGVSMMIMEVSNGYPNGSRIIGECHLTSDQVSTSNDASLETVFNFSFPVFLNNNTEYAYMIVPDGNNPEYNIWVSEVGGQDIVTKQQVFTWPYTGVMFVSSNASAWTALQKEDIKFNIYRAEFTSTEGTAQFQNESDDFFTVDGFTIRTPGTLPRVGDVVVRTNGTLGTIIVDTANTDYAFGYVQYINQVDSHLYLDSSTGNFGPGDTIEIHRPTGTSNANTPGTLSSSTRIAHCKIVTVDNIEYHAVVPRFLTMEPAQTSVAFKFKGTDETGAIDSAYQTVTNDYDFENFVAVHNAFAKSNETAGKTTFFQATLRSASKYMSPVIDLRRKSSLLIKNIINNDASDEHLRYGKAVAKYISKNTTLDDKLGNAEDLLAIVGAYRPAGTDIKVYCKLIGSDDGDTFDQKLWTEMPMREGSENTYSSPFDTTDYREYEFVMPYATVLGTFIGDGTLISGRKFSTRNVLGDMVVIPPAVTPTLVPRNNIKITVNGVIKVRGVDYDILSGTDFEFKNTPATIPPSGAIIEVWQYTNITEYNNQTTAYLNDGKVEYKRIDGGVVSGYKTYCFKIVMLSDTGNKVPRLADFRSIALQR